MHVTVKVHASLHSESNSGWIWLGGDVLGARRVCTVRNVDSGKSVACEVRIIDENYQKHYDGQPGVIKLTKNFDGKVVANWWYRRALGISETQTSVVLDVHAHPLGWVGSIMAGCQHPDYVARLATRLGIVGGVVGIFGVLISLVPSFLPPAGACLVALITLLGAVEVTKGCEWAE